MNFDYRVNTASEVKIFEHLNLCSYQFEPPLHEEINLNEYSKKITSFAETFEAWNQKLLIGLIAIYYNDRELKTGFVTNVSVHDKYTGQRIGSKLLEMGMTYGLNSGFTDLALSVRANNKNAIRLYEKFSFSITDEVDGKYKMKAQLK